MASRDPLQRKTDSLAALEREVDAWVASADADGIAYLIPLSYLWDEGRMVFATPDGSRTLRNLRRAGRTRVSLPSTSDVVILDGRIEITPLDGDLALIERFVARCNWDPRAGPEHHVLFVLTPTRIQAWRDVAELTGRDLMRDGVWVV